MPVQKHKTTQPQQTKEVQEQEVKDQAELKATLDDLLDDIDEVLEKNAEEFVRNYVQKGGQ